MPHWETKAKIMIISPKLEEKNIVNFYLLRISIKVPEWLVVDEDILASFKIQEIGSHSGTDL